MTEGGAGEDAWKTWQLDEPGLEAAAGAGSAGVGRYGSGSKPKSPEVTMLRKAKRTSGDDDGGGGNRTRARFLSLIATQETPH